MSVQPEKSGLSETALFKMASSQSSWENTLIKLMQHTVSDKDGSGTRLTVKAVKKCPYKADVMRVGQSKRSGLFCSKDRVIQIAALVQPRTNLAAHILGHIGRK